MQYMIEDAAGRPQWVFRRFKTRDEALAFIDKHEYQAETIEGLAPFRVRKVMALFDWCVLLALMFVCGFLGKAALTWLFYYAWGHL